MTYFWLLWFVSGLWAAFELKDCDAFWDEIVSGAKEDEPLLFLSDGSVDKALSKVKLAFGVVALLTGFIGAIVTYLVVKHYKEGEDE